MKDKYKKLMTLVVVLLAGLATGVTNAKLVAHWGLDGNVRDSVGSNHGTIVGNPTWETGRSGRALLLDGNDHIVLPNESNFDIVAQITVAAWIKSGTSNKPWQAIVTKGDNSWRLQRRNQTKNVKFNCSGLRGEKIGPSHIAGIEGKANVSGGRWHHVTGVYDGSKLSLYIDGLLDVSAAASGRIGTNNFKVCIGENDQKKKYGWNGLIDDVTIFDHALSEDEIIQLYRLGGISFTSEPTGLKLSGAVQRAETITKEQGPKEAITFLEEAIAEYEQWKEKNPNDIQLADRGWCSDLRFLLVNAMDAAGAPKQDVAYAYRRAIQPGMFFSPKDASALLWLHDNTNASGYDDIVEPLIQSNSAHFIKEVAAKAEMMVREQNSKAAIRFLEGNLAAHTRWRQKHPFDEVNAEDKLPEIYFQLAKTREAAEMPKKDIADAYRSTFNPSRFDYVPERTAALVWLVENERTDECAKAIESFTQDRETKDCFKITVAKVCEHFRSKTNSAGFQWFLDTLFTEAEYPYDWAIFMDSYLAGKTDRWTKAYYSYLDSRPRLKIGRDGLIAERYAVGEKFKEAAQLYQDIVDRCGPDDDKGLFEYQLCRCLFYDGKYREAVAKLENFIPANSMTHRSLVKEAMLMKARSHVQLGEIDNAIDVFFAVMIEYPDTQEMPETNFFIGYCYMLQSNYDQATEAFSVVVQTYPKSSYASKARMCLARIKKMTQ